MKLNDLFRNWKTSVAALITALGAVIKVLAPNKSALIDRAAEVLILAGPVLGLLFSKDGDKSGTSDNPVP